MITINPNQPLVNGKNIDPVWFRWLSSLFGSGLPVSSVTGSSPVVFKAPSGGKFIASGGTVSLIEFSRDSSSWYATGMTSGIITLSQDDGVRVTYSAAPTMTFIPG